ncbi:MAG: DUF2752 domain-containing protein [candidate division KSB1 bacterium]|nr:DUF2752 domain-containing protein [candidate division KSB1 bacterium]MDQ7063489.1 DUF2752 domain-containing protein [candidate division KSB1 bacterium]
MGLLRIEKAPRFHFHAGWIFWGAVLLGWIWLQQFPQMLAFSCPWKQLLNIPCVTCGATRSVFALAQFNLIDAVYFNPLIAMIMIGGIAAGLAAFIQATTGYKIGLGFRPGTGARWTLLWLGLLAANELYLIVNRI